MRHSSSTTSTATAFCPSSPATPPRNTMSIANDEPMMIASNICVHQSVSSANHRRSLILSSKTRTLNLLLIHLFIMIYYLWRTWKQKHKNIYTSNQYNEVSRWYGTWYMYCMQQSQLYANSLSSLAFPSFDL